LWWRWYAGFAFAAQATAGCLAAADSRHLLTGLRQAPHRHIDVYDLVLAGLERGSAGAVSGLASVFPEQVVALVRDRAGDVSELRRALDRYPFQAAAKFVLGRRGLPVREDVRLPLRHLKDEEKRELDAWLESS